MSVISQIASFGKDRKNLGYILLIVASSFSVASFLQSALVRRGYGQFLSLRLLFFELVSLFGLSFLWFLISVFFSRKGGLDLVDALRWDALSSIPLLVLFLNLPLIFVSFLNLEKTLLLLAFAGSLTLKVFIFKSKFDLWEALSRSSVKDLSALFFLIVLVLLFFWRIVSSSPLHQGSLAEDFSLFFPFRFFAATSLGKGIIPLWNPYIFSGTPFLADSQVAIFYPVNLLLTLLATPSYLSYKAAEWAVVINFILAGIFMYLYARTIRISSYGSLVSAVVFAFGGFMVSHVRHLPVINVIVWLPLILLFLEKSLVGRKFIYSIPAGIALGASILGGHLQMVLYVVYFVFAYGLFRIYVLYKEQARAKEIGWSISFLVAVYVIAISLTAVQTFPTLELLPYSNRSIDVSYGLTTDFSLEAQNLIMLFVPNFFGGISGRYWGPWSYWWEMCGYVGILPLILGIFALVLIKKIEVKFFGVAAFISLLLVLGSNTFLHPLTYLFLPGFALNRAPSRFFYIFGFALAILAGYGSELMLKPVSRVKEFLTRTEKALLWIMGVGVLAVLFFYYALANSSSDKIKYQVFSNIVNGTNLFLIFLALSIAIIYLARKETKQYVLSALVVGLVIFDLFSFGWQWYVEEKKPAEYYASDPIIEFLKKDKDFFRVVNSDILSPNAGSAYSIFTTSGSNPLSLKEYEGISQREDLLNVKYVLSKKNLDKDKYELVFADGERKVFQRKIFTPRAFVPTKVVMAESAGLLEGDKFDAQSLAVIGGADAVSGKLTGENRGEVRIVSYQPNKISLEAQMKDDGFVVLSEIYYPGWKAYVDDKPSRVYRADKLLRAVFIPKGKHKMVMVFDPGSYKLGLRFTIIAWLVIGVILTGKAGIYFKSILWKPRD